MGSPRSTRSTDSKSTAGSSPKTMNIKAKKNGKSTKIWSSNHVKPINLFDPNIHKPQKKIAQSNEDIERLMKKQKEDAFKKSTYDYTESMINLYGNELDEEEIDYKPYPKLLEKMSDRAYFNEKNYLERVNDGQEKKALLEK